MIGFVHLSVSLVPDPSSIVAKRSTKIKTRKKEGEGRVWANGLSFGVAKAGMLSWVIIACGTCDKCVVCMCG